MLHETKKRVYEVKTVHGHFRFFADNKQLAEDHMWSLECSWLVVPISKVKFIGWAFESDDLDKMFVAD